MYQSGTQLTPGEANVVVMTPEAAKVVQKHLIKISGRVVDAATEQPIARFRTTAGYRREAREKIYWLQDSNAKGCDGAY